MNRITAINEESEIDDEDENQVTKEAEVFLMQNKFLCSNITQKLFAFFFF